MMLIDNSITWAIKILNDSGYQTDISIPEIVQNTPWSVVYRFKTNKGFFFLKKVPSALFIEPEIINMLHKEFNATVPYLLAVNHENHCFLMQDAGIRLHDYFKDKFQSEILIKTMQDYAILQIKTLNKIDLFLDSGVPDWRLPKLPKLYQALVAQEDLLTGDGLSNDELNKLKNLEPKLSFICDKLSQYKIKETFGHADFHDKNILINVDTNQTTIIDLGEVIITHPFFSFLNCLHRAKENFSLSNDQYQDLQRICFKPWLGLDTQEHLFEILSLIEQCWPIHSVLGELRLMNSVDQSSFQELRRQGRLARNLRHWIELNTMSE